VSAKVPLLPQIALGAVGELHPKDTLKLYFCRDSARQLQR
jgi:hypothetical protein